MIRRARFFAIAFALAPLWAIACVKEAPAPAFALAPKPAPSTSTSPSPSLASPATGTANAATPSPPLPPQASRRPALHEPFGVLVVDDYEWLEDDKNPETISFANAENAYARSVLDRMPGRAELRTRMAALPESKDAYVTGMAGALDALAALRKRRFITFNEALSVAVFGDHDTVYAISYNGAPRGKVVSYGLLSGRHFDVVAESDGILTDLVATRSALYLIEVALGSSRVRRLPLGVKPEPLAREVPKPEPSKKKRDRSLPRTSRKNALPQLPKSASPLATTIPLFDRGVALAELPIVPFASVTAATKKDNDLLLRIETYLDAPAWYRYLASEHRLIPMAPATAAPRASMNDAEVVREACTSNGGTKVFMNIVRRKATVLSGANPTLLLGHEMGHEKNDGIPTRFRPWLRAWLDAGGILAEADLRGTSKAIETIETSRAIETNEKVANDFFECAKTLILLGYTKPNKLGIMSHSANSFLVGAAMVQHPEMFRAVVSDNGNYDSLGKGAKNETELRAQLAFSPYYNIKNDTTYPAVLFMTSDGNRLASPMARKMVARLRAANSGSRPILLRTSEEYAAGNRREQEIDATIDMLAFLFNELGMQLPTDQ